MIRNILLFCLFGFSLLWAESVEFNTNGTDYEMGATLHTRIDAATNGHITLGYMQSDDEFDTRQKLLFLDAMALSKKPYDRWTFGFGGRLLKGDINHDAGSGGVTAIAAAAQAYFHVPIRRKLYAAISYYYAPSFLVISDHFEGYEEIRIELDIALTKQLKGYFGGKNTRLEHKDAGSYELSNAGFVGLKYLF